MNREILFIVSSAIYITSKPLCYSPDRSAFNAEERAQQTLKTIESIRTTVPNAKILLIEMGLIKNLPYNMENMVDKYLYLGDKKEIREAADGPFKGLGEAMGLYLANESISSFNADYYFKISGRYYLNKEFNINNWIADGYTGRDYYGGLFTVLYGFPKRLYENWRNSLKESFPILLQGESIEIIQAKHLEKPFYYLSKMGVSGWEAHSGSVVIL
jgi:hypothetical protein